MDLKQRAASWQASLPSRLSPAPAARAPDCEPVGPLEIADEMLDAFLPDDDLEPLPDPADFWLE